MKCERTVFISEKYRMLSCRSLQDIHKALADNFRYKTCQDCDNILEHDNKPIFLSELIVVKTSDLGNGTLEYEPASMFFVKDYALVGAMSTISHDSFMYKNSSFIRATPDLKLMLHNLSLCANEEMIAVFKGMPSYQEKDDYVINKRGPRLESCDRYNQCKTQLELSLVNIVYSFGLELKIAVKLLSGRVIKKSSEFEYLLQSLFKNVIVINEYSTCSQFFEASTGSILSQFNKVKKNHEFIVFIFQYSDAAIVAQLPFCNYMHSTKVYCIGDSDKLAR